MSVKHCMGTESSPVFNLMAKDFNSFSSVVSGWLYLQKLLPKKLLKGQLVNSGKIRTRNKETWVLSQLNHWKVDLHLTLRVLVIYPTYLTGL